MANNHLEVFLGILLRQFLEGVGLSRYVWCEAFDTELLAWQMTNCVPGVYNTILHTGHIRRSIRVCRHRTPESDFNIGPQTENRLKKLVMIWRALHESVNVVHDPEKQYRSFLITAYRPHLWTVCMSSSSHRLHSMYLGLTICVL